MQSIAKPEFSLKSFNNLMSRFSSKYVGKHNGELKKDWKAIVRNEFALTSEQDQTITNCTKSTGIEVQKYFDQIADHLKNGGHISGMVIQNKDKTHSINIFLGNQKTPEGSMYITIVIAHCDANCRNWGWGRGKRK